MAPKKGAIGIKCATCNGKGIITRWFKQNGINRKEETSCVDCKGAGRVYPERTND